MIGKKIRTTTGAGGRGARAAALRGSLFATALALAFAGFGCGNDAGSHGSSGGQAESGQSPPPNVVLIVLESLRADHLGCYGYDRETSPVLDAFAAGAVRFANAHSVTSWTLPAHASILTGEYPAVHGVTEPDHSLADGIETLAERLASRPVSYETAGFVSAPFLRRTYNLHQGFATYDDEAASPTNVEGHADITNPVIEAKVRSWIDRANDVPFFLYVHMWDIHFDYIPPAPYDTLFVDDACEPFDLTEMPFNDAIRPDMKEARLRYLISQYDGEIRCADALVGRLFDRLKARGSWDNTIVVVTADHGEEFFEHGAKGHKKNLHGTSLRVPLLIKPAGAFEPGVVEDPVSLVSVAPRILSLLDGAPLAAFREEANVFAELDLNLHALVDGEIVASRVDHHESIERDGWKLIRLPRKGGVRLFDIAGGDRAERHDLAPARPGHVRDLLAALDARNAAAAARAVAWEAGAADLDEDEKKRLRGLGYLGP